MMIVTPKSGMRSQLNLIDIILFHMLYWGIVYHIQENTFHAII